MKNPAEAHVDLNAIKENISFIKQSVDVDLMAVVKADAYGHGLVPCAKAALDAGATWLGVALLEEALTLRGAGITAPILAWLIPPGSDFARAIENDIDLAVPSIKSFNEIRSATKNKRARIHIEVDTGMTRGGFLDEWDEFLTSDFSEVDVIGIFSHFARADEPENIQNQIQLENFESAIRDLSAVGINPPVVHLSNSAATMKDPASRFTLVRIGIAMYGLSPDIDSLGSPHSLGLRPAMELRAKLHLVKQVPAGAPVGYGATAITHRATVLGIVAMGYADGIPRVSQGVGIFHGKERAPIIGRVSMDQFVVDLGPDSKAQSGDEVIVFGAGAEGEYTADDWGKSSGSINYEIVTRIGPRVHRIYGL